MLQKVQKTQFEKKNFEPGIQPMEFISVDLIGEFHPPLSKGNRYALTAVCMLTGYMFCIPLKNKTAEEIIMISGVLHQLLVVYMVLEATGCRLL